MPAVEIEQAREDREDLPSSSPETSSSVPPEPVPLRTDAHEVIRVAGTRVTLDTVALAFDAGATPEEIAENYPLRLADVYAVITYYLRHQQEVKAYLERRRRQAEAVRREVEARFDQRLFRERLLARMRGEAA